MKPKTMNQKITRRDFLKLCGLTAGAGLFTAGSAPVGQLGKRVGGVAAWLEKVGADPQVEFNGRLIKGTQDGRILTSEDAGISWKVIAVLHPDCPIAALKVVNGGLAALLDFHGHPFSLWSVDGKVWRNG